MLCLRQCNLGSRSLSSSTSSFPFSYTYECNDFLWEKKNQIFKILTVEFTILFVAFQSLSAFVICLNLYPYLYLNPHFFIVNSSFDAYILYMAIERRNKKREIWTKIWKKREGSYVWKWDKNKNEFMLKIHLTLSAWSIHESLWAWFD